MNQGEIIKSKIYEDLVGKRNLLKYLNIVSLSTIGSVRGTKDIIQTALTKGWEKAKSFSYTVNPQVPLLDNEKVKHWFGAICRNVAIDYAREELTPQRKRVYLNYKDLASQKSVILYEDPFTLMARVEDTYYLRSAISELPKDFRIIIQMHYYQDMSYKAIAQTLDISQPTVRIRLYRARNLLSKMLENGANLMV